MNNTHSEYRNLILTYKAIAVLFEQLPYERAIKLLQKMSEATENTTYRRLYEQAILDAKAAYLE